MQVEYIQTQTITELPPKPDKVKRIGILSLPARQRMTHGCDRALVNQICKAARLELVEVQA